ncbi:MAG: SOS response-associated peptidase [Alphaproteobacteria bacterium]|nr:SOS response-associated peptidase [Alphaproteobacteria bacterium]
MCGRYSITMTPDMLRRLFGVVFRDNLAPRWNMAPTQAAPVIHLGGSGGRVAAMMRWGLVPSWVKDVSVGAKMINARAETVAEKPSFRAAYRRRRCLVPADGFYEWKTEGGIKQPWRVARQDQAPFAFAGLWELWEGRGEGSALQTFTILTTEANATLRDIHHRMPVMLFEPEQFEAWLTADTVEAEALMTPCDPEAIMAYRVDPRVGNVRHDDAGLIEPVAAPPPSPSEPPQGSLF